MTLKLFSFSQQKRGGVPLFLVLAGGTLLLLGFGLLAFFALLASDLPRPESFLSRASVESSRIYDRSGKVLLYEVHGDARREHVRLEDVSALFTQSVLVAEDRNFYAHVGVDIRAIARALATNLKLRQIHGGASTISQQFIRNSLLTNERTVARKVKEVMLTLELERRYSKDQILEFYVNQIPFGSNVYGVGTASRFYFGKSPRDLSFEEAALLASIPKAPTRLSLFGKQQKRLFARKDYILDEMRRLGLAAPSEYWTAKRGVFVVRRPVEPIRAPHFVMYVIQRLKENYGDGFLLQGGVSVVTTLDWDIQQKAEEIVKSGIERVRGYNAENGALVILHSPTGEILAMVGSKDWFGESSPKGCAPGNDCLFDPKVNVATAKNPGRQPGSAFKPVVYAAAFLKGYTPETVVVDEETNFGIFNGKPYIPHNYDGVFRGPVTLRAALAQSLNVPSVKVLEFAGVKEVVRFAKDLGITTLQDPSRYGLSLVLGGGEVSLLELSSAYGVFANNGFRVSHSPIKKIVGGDGSLVFQHSPTPQRVLSPLIAEQITSILSDNNARAPIFGLSSPLVVEGRRVAVKTGTTQEYRDAWTIGYTPEFTVGVWVGNNNNAPIDKKPGAMIAAPIWQNAAKELLRLFPTTYEKK